MASSGISQNDLQEMFKEETQMTETNARTREKAEDVWKEIHKEGTFSRVMVIEKALLSEREAGRNEGLKEAAEIAKKHAKESCDCPMGEDCYPALEEEILALIKTS